MVRMSSLIRLGAAGAAILSLSLGAAADNGAASDPYAGAVARTVRGIFEYSRWPQPRNPLVLCVVGAAQHAGQLGNFRLVDGRQVVRRNVAAHVSALGGCDALYIGSIALTAQRQVTASVRGKGVLTIAESDPGSSSEAMFALTYKPGALSFRLNIDAVSRSGIKVDPRVLRVAKGGS
ncbi:MAG: YfiR family protein [Novosphingobium sp.]|uniref:YfiR family protein n=1 Tax=Novosphingobium sp. TaxID=1874826 RepID=UPI0032BA8C22